MSRQSKQQKDRLLLWRASMAFANNRAFAMELAKKGNRDGARFWGSVARRDWGVIYRLLTC